MLWRNQNLPFYLRSNNTPRKLLNGSKVVSERHVCTQWYALQLNSVLSIEVTWTTEHWFRWKRTLNHWDLENEDCIVLGEKPDLLSLCPAQIPHRLGWDQIWACVVRGQWLTSRTMAYPHVCHIFILFYTSATYLPH
jgi:hypothetical protein